MNIKLPRRLIAFAFISIILLLFASCVPKYSDWPFFRHDAGRHGSEAILKAPLLGNVVWKTTLPGKVFSSPTSADGIVYVGCFDNNLYALDAASGTQLFSSATEGDIMASPVVSGKSVFVSSMDGSLYSFDASNGNLNWKFQTAKGVVASPVVGDGIIFFGSYDANLYALDAHNGKLLWQFPATQEFGQARLITRVVSSLPIPPDLSIPWTPKPANCAGA